MYRLNFKTTFSAVIKKAVLLSGIFIGFVSCGDDGDSKENQTLSFGYFAPQNLSSGSVELKATASSGLPVTFTASDNSVIRIEGNRVVFLTHGVVSITATQPGNDHYYEAPGVTRTLTILYDQDPSKKEQTIEFTTEREWKSDQGLLELTATASSGLSVTFTCNDPDVGAIDGNNRLGLIYGNYKNFPLVITASQRGNDEYNPAPNVTRTIYVEHIH
jgi:hypothetical protein